MFLGINKGILNMNLPNTNLNVINGLNININSSNINDVIKIGGNENLSNN